VVLVGAPTPVGVARLLDWIMRFKAVNQDKPIHVVLNRAPRGAFRRGELAREVFRSFVPASFHVLPADQRVEEAAWSGRLVSGGPFVRGVAELAEELPQTPVPVRPSRARRSGLGLRGGRR